MIRFNVGRGYGISLREDRDTKAVVLTVQVWRFVWEVWFQWEEK